MAVSNSSPHQVRSADNRCCSVTRQQFFHLPGQPTSSTEMLNQAGVGGTDYPTRPSTAESCFRRIARWLLLVVVILGFANVAKSQAPDNDRPPLLKVAGSEANSEAEMQAYEELIEQTGVKIEMLPIPGGSFMMGSSEDADWFEDDELPQHEVDVAPFWMSKTEITWDAYDVWMSDLDIFRRQALGLAASPRDELADQYQISQPTKPYTDMTFGMGKRGYPAISMTQHAARTFCKWLSAKTGRYYRLPTEAEWEYACRAGTTTAYSFGDDEADLEDYAWFFDNAEDGYRKVAQKKPNPWGLHDMHGNVAEWVLDQYNEAGYEAIVEQKSNPLAIPLTLYPRVVRGGGWTSFPEDCRSAAREASNEEWIKQDPQNPKSIWYLTDAQHVGFRIVRPLNEPTPQEKAEKWDRSEPVQVDQPE